MNFVNFVSYFSIDIVFVVILVYLALSDTQRRVGTLGGSNACAYTRSMFEKYTDLPLELCVLSVGAQDATS